VVFVSTPDGRYLDMNPAGIAIFGYSSKEELFRVDIGKDIYVNPEDRKKLQNWLDEKGEIAAYRGIMRDITEHKRLEQQLFQAQKMEAVGQLAGGVAHDLNNILTAIMGYGSLLQTKISADSLLNDYVKQILGGANRAAEVTKSLLASSRKQMMHPSPVDLNDIVRGISANHTFLDGNKIAGTACAWTFFYLNGYEVDENHDAELADMILDLFAIESIIITSEVPSEVS
jgi:signal transduction histidine kinase